MIVGKGTAPKNPPAPAAAPPPRYTVQQSGMWLDTWVIVDRHQQTLARGPRSHTPLYFDTEADADRTAAKLNAKLCQVCWREPRSSRRDTCPACRAAK